MNSTSMGLQSNLPILIQNTLQAHGAQGIRIALKGVLAFVSSRPHDPAVDKCISQSPNFVQFLRRLIRNGAPSLHSKSFLSSCDEGQAMACELVALLVSKCSFDVRKLVVQQLACEEKSATSSHSTSIYEQDTGAFLSSAIEMDQHKQELRLRESKINIMEMERKQLLNQFRKISNQYDLLKHKFEDVTKRKEREVILLRKENALLMNHFGLQPVPTSKTPTNDIFKQLHALYENTHNEEACQKTPTGSPPRAIGESPRKVARNLTNNSPRENNFNTDDTKTTKTCSETDSQGSEKDLINGCKTKKAALPSHKTSLQTTAKTDDETKDDVPGYKRTELINTASMCSTPTKSDENSDNKKTDLSLDKNEVKKSDSQQSLSNSSIGIASNHSCASISSFRNNTPAIHSCRWKKRNSKGKISKTDLRVAHLPPVPKCTKNKFCRGGCATITDCVDYQQRMRDEYCDFVREHDHHSGNLYIAKFLLPNQRKTKESILEGRQKIEDASVGCIWCQTIPSKAFDEKHEWSRETCEGWLDSVNFHIKFAGVKKFNYAVPWINEKREKGRHIEVCAPTFQAIYGLSSDRMTTVRKVRLQSASFETIDRRCLNGGHNAKSNEEQKGLEAVLESEPRSCTKSLDGSGKMIYSYKGNLSRFHFWRKYLLTNGSVSDVEFVLQSERLKFYPTFHNPKKRKCVPTDEVYANDKAKKQLKPSIAYTTACTFWKNFDLRFAGNEYNITNDNSSTLNEEQHKDSVQEDSEKKKKEFHEALHTCTNKTQ